MFQDLKDLKDLRGRVDAPSLDPQELQESEDRKETPDNKEHRDFLAEPELRAEKDRRDPEGFRVKTARRADQDPPEPSGLQEPRGPQVTRAPQERWENWDHRVLQEAKARKENEATCSRRRPSRPSPGRSASSSSRVTWPVTTPS